MWISPFNRFSFSTPPVLFFIMSVWHRKKYLRSPSRRGGGPGRGRGGRKEEEDERVKKRGKRWYGVQKEGRNKETIKKRGGGAKEGRKNKRERRSEKQHFPVPVLDNPSKWQNVIHPPCDSCCRSSLMVPNVQSSGNTIAPSTPNKLFRPAENTSYKIISSFSC